jgi:invasion protein IalB
MQPHFLNKCRRGRTAKGLNGADGSEIEGRTRMASRMFPLVRAKAVVTAGLMIASSLSLAVAQQRPAGQQGGQPAQQRPAQPQQEPAAAPVALKGDPNQQGWTKVCGRDPDSQRETCYTTRDFVAENNQPVLAVAVYETKAGGKAERQVRYLLPLTFLLVPGVRSSFDGQPPIPGRYTICVQNGCFAEFNVTDQVFPRMKSAKTLTIQVQNQAAREVTFSIPMDGFAAGFDGAPVDPRVLEEQQRKLQEELQRKSDEMRRQIQGGAPAPAAPGAPAPAAPAAPAPGAPTAPRQ